ncbi:MAG: sulfite oxidase [Nocardiopsaceae bacterium]|nr:sulfite oxidase [Nocardiopsaceae bacterium]
MMGRVDRRDLLEQTRSLHEHTEAEWTGTEPIVKPIPAGEFYRCETNAEMRWEVLRGQGYLVPVANFFVRNHTSTPVIDAATWRLGVFGTGLAGQPTSVSPVTFTLDDLLRLPSRTVVTALECAGNGRSFFATQQGHAAPGTPWKLGGIGVAAWTGVPLSDVLDRAGLTSEATDVMPCGLDPGFVEDGIDYGPMRRPIPVAKALDDVILAYEMNGRPLPPDHGYPVRAIVPGWAGVASVKWVGQIEVSATPLTSYWNTRAYRLFGPPYPGGGTLITGQVVKSAFELEWGARLPANAPFLLTGRSWSGNGPIARTEVSTDGGRTWLPATSREAAPLAAAPRGMAPHSADGAWQLWELPWITPAPGRYELRARATDVTGATQPATATPNAGGYLFDAVVGHPVTIA